MSNIFIFTGRLSSAPELTKHADTKVAKFTLLRNQYAGKDKTTGKAKERLVSIQFTAFDGLAEAIAEHSLKGDQLHVEAEISNNNYERDGEKEYGFNFTVQSFEFGAPGAEKRALLAERHSED